MSGSNQQNQARFNLGLYGLIATGVSAIMAFLYNGEQNRENSKQQREHERKMAEVALKVNFFKFILLK